MKKILQSGKPTENVGKKAAGKIIPGSAGPIVRQERGGKPEETEMTLLVHTESDTGDPVMIESSLRSSGIIHRAMNLIEGWGFRPARIVMAKVPIDIVAFREDIDLIAQVISSRGPLPDAKTIVRKYRDKIIFGMKVGNPSRIRKLLIAYSMPCGWKVYDIFPGGLQPAWDLPLEPTGT